MNTEQRTSTNFERALALVRRRGPIIVLCFLIAAGSAYVFAKRQRKMYTATAALLYQVNSLSQYVTGYQPVYTPLNQSQQDTNVRVVALGATAAETAKRLGPPWTAGRVKGAVGISPSSDTNIVSVSAAARTPGLAARIANAYANQFLLDQAYQNSSKISAAERLVTSQYNTLTPAERQSPQGLTLAARIQSLAVLAELQSSNWSLAGAANPPSIASPSSPRVKRTTALGAMIGLLIGLAIAFVLERFDRRIRDPQEFEAIYGLPLLGAVPERSDYDVLTSLGHQSVAPTLYDEVFNLLRSYLRYFSVDRDLRTLLVISAEPGEGKTTVSYNLAKASAALGSRVLLIEGDLRRGTSIGPLLERPEPALTDVLIGEASMQQAIRSIQVGPKGVLDVLIAGELPPPNASELIESHAMESVLERAGAAYDLVVIDTPPLSLVADAIPLLTRVDGVLIVGRVGRSRRDSAEQLHKRLISLRAPVLGIVANGVGGPDLAYRRGSYGYGQAYSEAYAHSANGGRGAAEPTLRTNGSGPGTGSEAPADVAEPV